MRARLARFFAILAPLACALGVVAATPALAPTASADNLPNGYVVTCAANGNDVICNISGCPRVKGQYAGDVIHTLVNGGGQVEIAKSCGNTATDTRRNVASQSFSYGVQGCRKHDLSSDDCGSWSDYKYTAPAAAAPPANEPKPVRCTAGPDAGKTLPPGSTCRVEAAPVKCPAGSQSDTVPAGKQCSPPANAVSMNITRNGFNATVTITNKSNLPAQCSYVATKTGGIGVQQVDRNIDVGASSTATITDLLWPPLGASYRAVAKCTVNYDGKQTPIGESSQNVSG